MKSKIMLAFLAAALSWPGCAVNIGGPSRQREEKVVVTERVVTVPAAPEDSATIAEIEAVAKLGFDATRTGGFTAIAERSGLSPNAQTHLVNTVFRSLEFENSRVKVLRTLIDNPNFSNAAKERILNQIHLLTFESNRKEILDAINHRGTLAK